MRRVPLVSCLGALLAMLAAPTAAAMGFGRTTMATTLGQRLDFVAHVQLDSDETLAHECIGAEVLIGDNRVGADNVRVTIENGHENGERRVRVATRIAVDEPVVTVEVRVGCMSQMTRRFVAFVDPPALRLASAGDDIDGAAQRDGPARTSAPDSARAALAARRVAAVGDDAARTAALRASRRAARSADAERRFDAAPALLPNELRPATVAAAHRPSRAGLSGRREASIGARPRLMLDAASGLTPAGPTPDRKPTPASIAPPTAVAAAALAAPAAAPPLAASAPSVVSASTTEVAPTPAADAARIARIEELEAGLARARADAQAQQRTLAEMQARLRGADSSRYANGLVYGLAAAVVFFALLAAAIWAVRPRQRARARWFDPNLAGRPKRAPDAAAAPGTAPNAEAAVPAVSQHPSQWRESGHAMLPVTAPATIGGLEVTTVLAPQSHYARMIEAGASANAGAVQPVRPSSLSMGDLIDLEQQAEFFVVLGQDEAAIALLSGHLHDTGGASPLPFLQLLEIHQRRGDEAAYEAVRHDYQTRFDALAPEWSSGLHMGRELEAYPQTIARLQSLWPTPMHAMQTLDGLIFRRSEDAEAFDFPAYRDLLFLYSIARELAGQVETGFGPIDLFLPLEGTSDDASSPRDGGYTLDVDVSGWSDGSEAAAPVVRHAAGRRSAG